MFRSATTRIAHSSTIAGIGGTLNKDLRSLQELINSEKAVLHSLQKLASDLAKASEAFRHWANGEGDDLSDVATACTALIFHYSSALARYAALEETIREQMKAIRSREEQLDELKRRRKGVATKADAAERKLSKMNPEHKNMQAQSEQLTRLRDEMRSLDTDIMNEEASLGDFKRYSVKNWMGMKFGGLQECCQKGAIIGELGKLVIAEIPLAVTQPGLPRPYYNGHARTEYLISEANRAVSEVTFSTEPTRDSSALNIRPLPGSELPPLGEQNQPPSSPQHPGAPEASGSAYPGSPPQQDGPREAPMSVTRIAPPSVPQSSSFGLPQVAPNTPGSDVGLGPYLNQGQGYGSPFPQPTPQMPSAPLQGSYDAPMDSKVPEVNEFGGYNSAAPYAPRTSSMNNLGHGTHGSVSSITSGEGKGGRFATFPVKGSSGPPRLPPGASPPVNPAMIPPKMEDRPPSLDVRQNSKDDSFVSSIAQALGPQFTPQESKFDQNNSGYAAGDSKGAHEQGEKHRSFSPPPPMYSPVRGPEGHSLHDEKPQSGPPSQAPQANQEDPADVQLAYMSDPQESDNESSSKHPDRGDRRVRFGSVRDVDAEMEKRHAEQMAASAAQEQHSVPATPIVSSPTPQQPNFDHEQRQPEQPEHRLPEPSGPIVTSYRSPSPPTDENHKDDEKALNAAAAREVSRELDALMFNSPNLGQPQPIVRTPSPLQPPQPPFARGITSPQPDIPAAPPPIVPTGSRRQSLMSPLGPRAAEPQYVRERDRSPSNPASPTAITASPTRLEPSSPVQPPPTIKLPDQPSSPSGMSTTNNTPYRTPPEYPGSDNSNMGTPRPMYNMTSLTGSASSFTPSGGKISAAAFKQRIRQQTQSPPLGGSSPDTERSASLADVSPLSVKKRALPNSPYPAQRLQPGEANPAMQRVPSAPSLSAAAQDPNADWRNRSVSATHLASGTDSADHRRTTAYDDDFDYISAYVNNSTNSPEQSHQDYGHQSDSLR
ncbi:hypothetical protein K474DRAFT_1666083 [Panus rudis PR-1116 ss-1]|nr:hypothetical protein K474DRAFT_1666083 [Panus rudis PR-1116 ss-1]